MLPLSIDQQETLRILGMDGVEPLYRVVIQTGLTAAVQFNSAVDEAQFVIQGHTLQWSTTVRAPGSNVSGGLGTGIGAVRLEAILPHSVANAAAVLRDWAGVRAWSRGHILYFASTSDTTFEASGSGVSVQFISQTSYSFVSGSEAIDSSPPSVIEISSLSSERDPATNEVSRSRREITLRWDPMTEQLFRQTLCVGVPVLISRGVRSRPFTHWIPSGVFITIDAPLPENLGNVTVDTRFRPLLRIMLNDWGTRALDNPLGHFTFWAQHPLEVIERLCITAYERFGAPPTFNGQAPIDTRSLDPSTSQWYKIAHFQVMAATFVRIYRTDLYGDFPFDDSRTNPPEQGVGCIPELQDTTLRTCVLDLSQLLPAQISVEEDGVFRARPTISLTAGSNDAPLPARDWSRLFVSDDGPEVIYRDLITDIGIETGGSWVGDYDQTFADQITVVAQGSAVAIELPGRNFTIETKFLNALSTIIGPTGGITPTSSLVEIEAVGPLGFSGMHTDWAFGPYPNSSFFVSNVPAVPENQHAIRYPVSGEPATFDLSTWSRPALDRPVYLMFRAHEQGSADVAGSYKANVEVIASVVGATLPGRLNTAVDSSPLDTIRGPASPPWGLGGGVFFLSKRGLFRTKVPSIWHRGTHVQDITIPIHIAERILRVLAWDAPVVTGETPLSEMDIQLGDVVKIDLPHVLTVDGIGTNEIGYHWEVIGKEELRHAMRWRLVRTQRAIEYAAGLRVLYELPEQPKSPWYFI